MPPDVPPENARSFAIWVVQKLREAGYEALWAGGCVRDYLLGAVPSDYDVATSATPEEVRRCFGRGRTLAIGATFGVMTVRGRRDQGQIEVATFRCDAEYSDGRHPDHVSYSNAREDACRRDFTINGLFYDPLSREVIDYVGGRNDLEAGIIRAIGDPFKRIGEDKLRMLRAVRFATTFGFHVAPETEAAVRSEATQITVVSAERIAAELRKMLIHANRASAVQLLRDVELLPAILPEAALLWQPGLPAESVTPSADWTDTLAVLGHLDHPTFRVALAALLWRIGEQSEELDCIDSICERWKLSKHEQGGVTWMLAQQRTVRNATAVPWPVLQRVLVLPAVDELLTLASAIAIQVDGGPEQIEFCFEKLKLPGNVLNPPPLITGNDLLQAGYRAGPQFRHVLKEVRDAQLEGLITTKSEAMDLVADLAKRT